MCSITLFVFLFFIPVLTSDHVPEQYVRIEHIKVSFWTFYRSFKSWFVTHKPFLVDITNDEWMLCIKNWGILFGTTFWCWFLLGQINYLRHSDIFVFRRRLEIFISILLSDHSIWTHDRGRFISAPKSCPVSWPKLRIWTT